MSPPQMAGWNLALRFGLEMAALTGLATAAWRTTAGPGRWPAVIVAPVAAAAVWAIFNVPDDPSRSGNAPVQVPGGLRLTLELVVLGAGAVGFYLGGSKVAGVSLAALVPIHYAASIARIEWLLDQ